MCGFWPFRLHTERSVCVCEGKIRRRGNKCKILHAKGSIDQNGKVVGKVTRHCHRGHFIHDYRPLLEAGCKERPATVQVANPWLLRLDVHSILFLPHPKISSRICPHVDLRAANLIFILIFFPLYIYKLIWLEYGIGYSLWRYKTFGGDFRC